MSLSSPLGPERLRLDKHHRASPSKSSGRKAKSPWLPLLQIPPVVDDDSVSEMDNMEDIPPRLPSSDRDALPNPTSSTPLLEIQVTESPRSEDTQASDGQESGSSFRPSCLGTDGYPQTGDENMPVPTQGRATPPEWMSHVPDGIIDDNSYDYESERHHNTSAKSIPRPPVPGAFQGTATLSGTPVRASLEASPTMRCKWDTIAAFFNRALTLGSDFKMTSESLREAVAWYPTPVGPESEVKLSLETMTATVKAAVSCGKFMLSMCWPPPRWGR
ncbi:hypothetical protein CEP54_015935 [Fusarium duplospermum]|uniref:Uncharacterized protein n=1 Tax=Fusarium duplospermum TaxID=1325734 RepID=A0A428NK27_9HYPO|nr:hypothetical protein CEP54_015935 [Fusarium duplospermum]